MLKAYNTYLHVTVLLFCYINIHTLGAGPSLLLLSPWTARNDKGGVLSLSGVLTCGRRKRIYNAK